MTPETATALGLALLVLSAGVMIAMIPAMWRGPRPLVRWSGIAFDLSVAAGAIKEWNEVTQVLGPVAAMPLMLAASGLVGWFWLFVMALFADACRFRPSLLVPPGLLIAIHIVDRFTPEGFAPWCWIASAAIQAGLALHALAIIVRGWKGDLVETRRRLRGPFLITVTVYIIARCAFETWDNFFDIPDWYWLTNTAVHAALCFAGAFVFLDVRADLFGVATAPHPGNKPPAPNANGHANGNGAAAIDRAEKADLDRLEALMTDQEIWREEGLTIATLATRAGIPETQLRRLINDRLGHRNFPSYVNARRICAAKLRLSDPNEARTSIAAIAFDIGFGSLGPFNRAFREETGISPSEWRRTAFSEPSPISEKYLIDLLKAPRFQRCENRAR